MKKILVILAALALILALAACGQSAPSDPDPAPDIISPAADDGGDVGEAAASKTEPYIGGWYGWWAVFEPTGDVGSLQDGDWFDCCADIERIDEDTVTMTIWDELSSRSEPIAVLDLYVGGTGIAYSLDGSSFLSAEVGDGEIAFSLDDATYEDMLYIDGVYDDGSVSFTYMFILRPWGCLWDDIEADSPEDLPYGYYDWYLPLLEEGSDIPDVIDLN